MSSPLYLSLKGQAYPILAAIASCDHPKATSQGYRDGWQLLIDRHDGPEMASFCLSLPTTLTPAQAKVLLDGLAQEYTQFSTWLEFVDAGVKNPGWKPSEGSLKAESR
jgi:hypothetical protein